MSHKTAQSYVLNRYQSSYMDSILPEYNNTVSNHGFIVNGVTYYYNNKKFYKQAPYSDVGIELTLEEIFPA